MQSIIEKIDESGKNRNMLDIPHETVMEEYYTTPSTPGSFTSAEKLKQSIKKYKNINLSIDDLRRWLKKKDTYTKHRVSRREFKRNPVIAEYIDAQWQGDLAEVGNLARYNDGIRFLLVLIDIVSKFIWIEPVKSKHGKSVVIAFANIFKRTRRRPKKLQTDDGKEFLNRDVQRLLNEENIRFFTIKSDKKAALAERVIRTIKEKIYRYLHEKHTKRYIDVLQELVESYNGTYHKSIGMAPEEANEANEGEILERLYGDYWSKSKLPKMKTSLRKTKFKSGDLVRISRIKGVFKKGYEGNWTEEIFIVDKMISAYPQRLYKLKDWNQEPIEGSFYEYELQSISKDLEGYWKVEKIIKTKVLRGGRKKYFVKWEGYPDAMNSWVSESDIKPI